MRNVILVLLLLLMTACSLQQQGSNKLAEQLQQESPEKILFVLQDSSFNERDSVQYYLNLGYLQLLSGQFTLAIESLHRAKQGMQSLSAVSISENLEASTINETLRSYSGYPTDKVMVHNMLALSYIFKQDIEGARVEMLQADIAMKMLAEDKSFIGQLTSTHLLSAIIYELLNEYSNAFISYQFTEKTLTKRNLTIPNGIKLALLRMSNAAGNDNAYEKYSEKYPKFIQQNEGKKQVFSFHFDGVVSNKKQESLIVPNHNGQQVIRISMPTYPKVNYQLHQIKLVDDKQNVTSEVIENINDLVREDLSEEYPSILLSTTARAIVKYTAVKEIDKKDPVLGSVFNLLTLISEVADLRSWNMLPATIQFSYLQTDANNISISTFDSQDKRIDIGDNRQHIILSTNLSNQLFHYQQ